MLSESMDKALCVVPQIPLRAAASHQSEMVSQLVFGELVELLEATPEHWIKVRCCFDGYEGWCLESQILRLISHQPLSPSKLLTSRWSTKIRFNGKPMHLPLGSFLPDGTQSIKSPWGFKISHKGKLWNASKKPFHKKLMKDIAFKFLNTPYLWGGKTVFGTDCSGFTQTVFRFFSISLLRDAWQQAEQGAGVQSLANAQFGDLAFFDNAEGRITHVGILLNKQKIIHASGKVRIDTIDEQGILNIETNERTHTLKLIRRFLS